MATRSKMGNEIDALIAQIRSGEGTHPDPRRALINIFNEGRDLAKLDAMLCDSDDLVVVDAAYILSEMVDCKTFHERALQALKNREGEARYYALSALDMNDPRTRPAIAQLLKDDDEHVRRKAAQLLESR